jgi:flagellar biosynthetic protein FliP
MRSMVRVLIGELTLPVLAAGRKTDDVSALLDPSGAQSTSAPLQIILILTFLTLLPALLMALTPFLRITLVLHFLRQALGTQGAPSNQVLIGLALVLTFVIMQPVVAEAYHKGWAPYEKGTLEGTKAFEEGAKPFRLFFLKFAREKDIKLFLEMSHTPAPASPHDLDLKTLAPAYMLSELRRGFQIGAVLFLPFLVIDLVVASVTLAIGMVQLPPVMISAPFKILLFVLVDGWNLVIGSLFKSFNVAG